MLKHLSIAVVFLDIFADFLSDFAVLTFDLRACLSLALIFLLSCLCSTLRTLVSSSSTPFVNDRPLSRASKYSSVLLDASNPASTNVSKPLPICLHPPVCFL
eukprot:Lithocolla_globosa_v1_NODE_12182_length_452_cov_28.259446.p2 type:complete len:102 gc:universal NODE_12182_length_452_cov_28.259446:41-346(+)